MLTLSKGFDYESEAEKCKEHTIEFLEAREDAAVTFEATEETLDFIAFLVERPVVAPGLNAIGFGRDYGNHVQLEHELTSFVAFVSAIHDHRHAGKRAQITKQFATFRRIMGITWRKCERYCGPSIRGNHMNLGSPSGSALADSLGSFFNAPVAAMNTNIQRTVVVLISALSWPYGWIVGNRIRPSRQSLELARVRYADVLLTDQKNNSNIVPTGTTSRTFINTKGISCR